MRTRILDNGLRLAMALAVLLWALAAAQVALGEDALPDADEVIAKLNARDEGEFVTRKLIMTMTDKRGKQRVRDTFGYRKNFGNEKRTVIFYLSPASIRDTGFLSFDYSEADRDDDQWLYLPAARKVRRISAGDRGDYFLGTDFTYEDMKNETRINTNDYNFKTLALEDVDGHPCYKIEGIPVDEKTAKELGYGKIHTWIDARIWMTRKSDFWDIRMNPLKAMQVEEIREIDGIQTVYKMSVQNHKTGHASVFEFTEVDYKAPVSDDVFTERALKRGVQGK